MSVGEWSVLTIIMVQIVVFFCAKLHFSQKCVWYVLNKYCLSGLWNSTAVQKTKGRVYLDLEGITPKDYITVNYTCKLCDFVISVLNFLFMFLI